MRWIAMAAMILLLTGPAWAASAAPATGAAAAGPRLSDAQFFQMLDLSRPDMAAVKAAAEKSDWPAATRALAEHLRSRKTPHWTTESRRGGGDSRRGNSGADSALAHRFSSIGIPWQFGPKIDWAFNYFLYSMVVRQLRWCLSSRVARRGECLERRLARHCNRVTQRRVTMPPPKD